MAADQIIIRPAKPEDSRQIAEVHVKTWQSSYADIFPKDRLAELGEEIAARTERWQSNIANLEQLPAFFVAETGKGKIVGFAGGGRQNNPKIPYDCEIFVIYILPKFQKRGIGRSLMSAASAYLQAAGFSSLILWVLEENASSRGFYEKLGGTLVGQDEYLRWGESYPLVAYGWDSLTALIST